MDEKQPSWIAAQFICIGDINYTSGRKLNRSLIERLAACEYITEHRNLFITGAAG